MPPGYQLLHKLRKNLGLFGLDKRKCICCGAELGDEDVMKIILEDGSCEVFPLDTCPECFKKGLAKKARR